MITVITVVLNAEKTLERCIRSVTEQNYGDLEYIVIDGGSIDKSIEIIKKYENLISFWVSETDEGIYDAMNKAMRFANGDWIYFLGADDELMPGVIKNCAKKMIDKSAIYYGNVYIPSFKKSYNGKFNKYKLMQSNICHQSIFYPKNVYKIYKYKKYFKIFADYYMNILLYGNGIKFKYINEIISIFNIGGVSSKPDLRFNKIKNILIKKHFGLIYFLLKKLRGALVDLIKCYQ